MPTQEVRGRRNAQKSARVSALAARASMPRGLAAPLRRTGQGPAAEEEKSATEAQVVGPKTTLMG